MIGKHDAEHGTPYAGILGLSKTIVAGSVAGEFEVIVGRRIVHRKSILRSALARTAACALVLAATVGPALAPVAQGPGAVALVPAAHALGEDGPFTLPADPAALKHTATLGNPGDFNLFLMVSAEDLETLDTDSMRLLSSTESEDARPTNGGKKLSVKGVGKWEITDTRVRFTPENSEAGGSHSVQFSVRSKTGYESAPVTLTVTYPGIPSVSARASEGEKVTVPLALDGTGVDPSSLAFTLEGLPAGSTLVEDGTRLIVPDEGTWALATDDRAQVTFTPRRERLGTQPRPITLEGRDTKYQPVAKGTVTVKTPAIRDVTRAAGYGAPVTFDLASAAANVDPSTLELAPFGGETSYYTSDDGLSVTVADQGTWGLDRNMQTLTFTPLGDKVRDVTPMGVKGKDLDGNTSSVAPMSVGYPQVGARYTAAKWGQVAMFTPLDGSLNVQPYTFAFTERDMPQGTTLSSDRKRMTVPGEGVWEFDPDSRAVAFTPDTVLRSSPHVATFTIESVLASNTTSGTLHAQYASAVPTARDDEALSNSRVNSVTIDVLGNDTPASPGQTFDSSTLVLRSSRATNIEELVAGSGRRLEIPEEGVFEVTSAGGVRFTPANTFVGRTTPIEYTVEDSAGLRTSAHIVIDVEPLVPSTASTSRDAGLSAIFGRLMPSSSATFAVFMTSTALLIFTGIVSLWVGGQMRKDRGVDL